MYLRHNKGESFLLAPYFGNVMGNTRILDPGRLGLTPTQPEWVEEGQKEGFLEEEVMTK